jgi:hypothetical protein
MAIAAGKSVGNAPRMADNAFKPPAEAAIAITRISGDTSLTGISCTLFGLDFVLINSSRQKIGEFSDSLVTQSVYFIGSGIQRPDFVVISLRFKNQRHLVVEMTKTKNHRTNQ